MANKPERHNNILRLLKNLEDNSFAAELVRASIVMDSAGSMESAKAVLNARLNQVRDELDATKN